MWVTATCNASPTSWWFVWLKTDAGKQLAGVKEVTWRRGEMRGFHRHTDAAMETMPLHGLQKRDMMDRIGNQSYTMHFRRGRQWRSYLNKSWSFVHGHLSGGNVQFLAMAASCAAGCWCCRVWVQPCCLPLPRPASYRERENEMKREVNSQKNCTVCQ